MVGGDPSGVTPEALSFEHSRTLFVRCAPPPSPGAPRLLFSERVPGGSDVSCSCFFSRGPRSPSSWERYSDERKLGYQREGIRYAVYSGPAWLPKL